MVRHVSGSLTKVAQFERVINPLRDINTNCAANTVGRLGRTAAAGIRGASGHVGHSIFGDIDIGCWWRKWTLVPGPFIVVIVAAELSAAGDDYEHRPKACAHAPALIPAFS